MDSRAVTNEALLGFVKGVNGEAGTVAAKMDSRTVTQEALLGFVKGVTGEAGTVAAKHWGKGFMCKEDLKAAGVSVEAVPAPTPVIGGKRLIRFKVDLEVKESIEMVGTPKVQAAVILAEPVMLRMVIAHLLFSVALVTMWHHFFLKICEWFKKKDEKNTGGGNEKNTGGGSEFLGRKINPGEVN